tara:strand:- start:994 stop:1632 length:639 start_codon:yes stop_codon:yes gene_type:complete
MSTVSQTPNKKRKAPSPPSSNPKKVKLVTDIKDIYESKQEIKASLADACQKFTKLSSQINMVKPQLNIEKVKAMGKDVHIAEQQFTWDKTNWAPWMHKCVSKERYESGQLEEVQDSYMNLFPIMKDYETTTRKLAILHARKECLELFNTYHIDEIKDMAKKLKIKSRSNKRRNKRKEKVDEVDEVDEAHEAHEAQPFDSDDESSTDSTDTSD